MVPPLEMILKSGFRSLHRKTRKLYVRQLSFKSAWWQVNNKTKEENSKVQRENAKNVFQIAQRKNSIIIWPTCYTSG